MKVLRPAWLAVLLFSLLVGAVAPEAWAAGRAGVPVASPSQSSTGPAAPAILTAWTSPMDLLLQPFPKVAADNATVRDLATVAVGGRSVSLRLSNQWGPVPLTFGAVTVGERAGTSGAAAVPGTMVPVTFDGSGSVTIPAGQDVTSDPAPLAVHAGETLVVSMWAPGVAPVSVHYCCRGRIVAYYTANGAGNQTGSLSGSAFTGADWWTRWLSAVEVGGSQALGTVVAFGDSITDGFGYQNTGFSWVEALQQRISQLPASEQVAVVNEGISGNTLTPFPPGRNASGGENSYAASGGGVAGVERLSRDALQLPGVKAVVVLLGTNDIWFGYSDNNPPYGSAASIIAGMKQLVAQVHEAGLEVYGIPLLPRKTSPACTQPGSCRPEEWDPAEQATLEAVDSWVMSPGNGFNGVVNLAAVVGDVYNGQCQPELPYAPYFNADNLHPNPAGQTAMANAIPTTLFGIPEAPQLPPVVAATPTPGCPGAQTAQNVIDAALSSRAQAGTGPSATGTSTAPAVGGSSTTTPSGPAPTVTSSAGSSSTTAAPASTSTSAVAARPTAPGARTSGGPGNRPSAVGGILGGLGSTGAALVGGLAFVALLVVGLSWGRRNSGNTRGR